MGKYRGSSNTILIVSIVIAFAILLTSVAGVVFYTQFNGEKSRLGLFFEDSDKGNQETDTDRIKELEDKLKDLEKRQPGPKDDYVIPPLTQNQISAVVELWCPDDNYEENGFISMGSGVIVSKEGVIFTNRHVVSNYDWSVIESSPTCYVGITKDISQPSKFKYAADLLDYSPEPEPSSSDYFDFDVAALYIYDICYDCPDAPASLPEKFPYLELGHSAKLSPGDYIAIIGYPEIGAGTWNFTDGIISGRVGDFVIKTDAKIDSGNSGGAALNAKNQLIGIPTWTISGDAESIGYIIAIDDVYEWFQEKISSVEK